MRVISWSIAAEPRNQQMGQMSILLGRSSRFPSDSITIPGMAQPSPQDDGSELIPRKAKQSRWPVVVIVLLLILFTLILLQRNRIRSYWWSYQLTRTEDVVDRTYFLASLAAVGEDAAGPIARLSRNQYSDVRLLSIELLQSLPHQGGLEHLARLLGDVDADVRESAALALAFMATDAATKVLRDAVASENANRAAAAALALGRIEPSLAWRSLCQAAKNHPSPRVRAQAIESLAGHLIASRNQNTAEIETRVFQALVQALADRATFAGRLGIERSIDNARNFARQAGNPLSTRLSPSTSPAVRCVADIAARCLSSLTGQAITPRVDSDHTEQAVFADRCHHWYRQCESGSRP